MDALTNLGIRIYLSYKALFLWLSAYGLASNLLLRPVLTVAMFALVGKFARQVNSIDDYIIGMSVYSMSFMVLGGVLQGAFYDRWFGTLNVILGYPTSRVALYFTRSLLHYPNGLIVIGVSFAFAWIFFGMDLSEAHVPGMALAVLLVTLSVLTFSMCMGAFSLVLYDWDLFFSLLLGWILIIGTGVIIPVSSLPEPASSLGHALPMTNGLMALRESIEGASLSAIGPNLLAEAVVAVVFAVLGPLLFVFLERRTRIRGSVEGVL